MKLSYSILWFEDDKDIIYETQGPALEEFLTSLGFTLKIDHRSNGKSLLDLIQTGDINKYDLIISDLNLGTGNETGRKLIDHIREAHIFTEVLLYSADDVELEAIIKESGWVERASFCVGADEQLRDKLKIVTRLSMNKQQDVNNTRGLVIAEAILLENKISSILEEYFETAEGTALDGEKAAILDNIRQGRLEHSQSHVSFLGSISSVNLQELIDKGIMTASNIVDALNSILSQRNTKIGNALNKSGLSKDERGILTEKQKTIKSLKKEMDSFKSEIIEVRNTLAHVKAQVGTDGILFLESRKKGGQTIRFDNDRYTQIRKDLHKHNRNLDDIVKHLADQE